MGTFDKFRQTAPKDYKFDFFTWFEMNHVEAAILDQVALLFPEVFTSLEDYFDRQRNFVDHTIRSFDREAQFYIACIKHMELHKLGLHFRLPTVTDESKEVCLVGKYAQDKVYEAESLVQQSLQMQLSTFVAQYLTEA